MNVVEVLAAIFSVIVLVKLISVFLIDDQKVIKIADKMFKQTGFLTFVMMALAVIVGYFLITSLGIIAVVAVMLFAHLLLGILILQYPKGYLQFVRVFFKDKRKMWLLAAIWIFLAVWALAVLFV